MQILSNISKSGFTQCSAYYHQQESSQESSQVNKNSIQSSG